MRLDHINLANLSGMEKLAMLIGVVGLIYGGYLIINKAMKDL